MRLKFLSKCIFVWAILIFGFVQLKAYSYNVKIKNNILYNTNATHAFVNLDLDSLYKHKSGYIMSELTNKKNTNEYSLISVSNGVIDEVYKKYGLVKFLAITKIKLKILFDTSLKPKDGDIFALNSKKNLSLLIAPNYDSYSYVLKNYPKMRFLPIDLFAMALKTLKQPLPTKENFATFCYNNDIADITLVLDGWLSMIDCYSFKEYKNINLDSIENKEHKALKKQITNIKQMTPFFTNIFDIKESFFDFSSYDDSYNDYYKNLFNLNQDKSQ